MTNSSKRRAAARFASVSLLCLSIFAQPVLASSHREAPGITKSPKVDSTDFYMFRSYEPGRAAYVTFIANYIPLQDPGGGPNYFTMDPDAVYEIHVDNTGDAKEDITYQFKFSNTLAGDKGVTLNIAGTTNAIPLRHAGPLAAGSTAALGESESYTLTVITGDRRKGTKAMATGTGGATSFTKPFDYAGTKTFSDYAAYANQYIYTVTLPGCSTPAKVFVGQRAEAFAVNIGPVFDLVNFVPIEGDSAPGAGDGGGFPGGIKQNRAANDTLYGKKNVTSIALEVAITCLTGSGNGVIGAWQTASLPQARLLAPNATYKQPSQSGGAYTQVSRLGMPLVNELVIGVPDKDKFNASKPSDDAQFAAYVTNPTLPAILDSLFRAPVNATLGTNIANLAPSNFPRNDLVAAFLTGVPTLNQLKTVTPSEMLRLNTAITPTPRASQKNLGVAGDDLAGFPNGRRPGDDTVDIALRVVMGALCHPIPINGTPTNLGVCTPAQAPVGNVPFTDGAPLSANDLQNAFPYLNTPLPGAQ
ncbi:DUF4331 domain-containing protein [Asticcacaulis sp. W401b]|uniref:DUF4331 domain-containing protein n=1 Tax=Asticcacaulis sp. W401b TaxID=3388666 RepID=UPI00397105BB